MAADLLSQLFRSRVSVLRGALNRPPEDDGKERRRTVTILYDQLLGSSDHVEQFYRSMWEHATSGTVDPVEVGNDLFAAWDNALEVLRQAQPGIEAAENAGDLSRGSAARLSNLTLSLQVERDKAHARWPWLTAADVESAIAQHTRGETIPNTELAGELQRRLAVRSAG